PTAPTRTLSACCASIDPPSTGSRTPCSRKRRSTAASSTRCSQTPSRIPARARRWARSGSSRCRPTRRSLATPTWRRGGFAAAIDELAEQGVELVDEEPRQGLFGLEVAFLHPDAVHGVLAELVADV